MRIVVVSDSHKDFYSLQKAVLSQSSAEVVVFCGDGNEDMDTLAVTIPDKMIISVRGNCDWCSEKRYSEQITLENKHIFVTHGHLFGVKSGYSQIINQAHLLDTDILLFGHTHVPYTAYDDGMYIMNPGSIGYTGTYGIVDITPSGIMTNIIKL